MQRAINWILDLMKEFCASRVLSAWTMIRRRMRTREIKRNTTSGLVQLYHSCITTENRSECGLSKEFNLH